MYFDLTTATDLDETKNKLNILKMHGFTRERAFSFRNIQNTDR